MSDFSNLLGHAYEPGRRDCYSICRDYFLQRWNIRLPNFARPTEFWLDQNLNLYGWYEEVGFEEVYDRKYREGDVLLMPYGTPFPTHAGVVCGLNEFLHHPPNGVSTIDTLRPKWSNRALIHIRHPEVRQEKKTTMLQDVVNAQLLRDPKFQEALARASVVEQQRREMRHHQPQGTDTGEEEPLRDAD